MSNISGDFCYEIVDAKEMIKQIELYLKTRPQSFHLCINEIIISFDEFKYTKSDFPEGNNIYEIYFFKNNDKIAYFEVYDDYKIRCEFDGAALYEIKILESDKKN